MVVNKYIRCVAACLGVACGCICADADAMGSTAGGAGGKDQVINPTGGTDQIKQTKKVRYKFNVKSDMKECQNVGEIYVKTDKTTGKVEKGILLYKGKDSKNSFFYVNDGGEKNGYYNGKCEKFNIGAAVPGRDPIVWTGVVYKDEFGDEVSESWGELYLECHYNDIVGGSGREIYGRLLRLISAGAVSDVGVFVTMEDCQNVGDIYVTSKGEKGILLYKGMDSKNSFFYVNDGCEKNGYYDGKCEKFNIGAAVPGRDPIVWTGVVYKDEFGDEVSESGGKLYLEYHYNDIVGGSGREIYGRLFKLITDKLPDTNKSTAEQDGKAEQEVKGSGEYRPVGGVANIIGLLNFQNNTENGKTDGNNGKKDADKKK